MSGFPPTVEMADYAPNAAFGNASPAPSDMNMDTASELSAPSFGSPLHPGIAHSSFGNQQNSSFASQFGSAGPGFQQPSLNGGFGAQNNNGFGAQNSNGFGAQNSNGFGAQNSNGFGSQNNSGFGSLNSGFGAQNNNGFGSQNNSGFGSQNSGFGAQNNGFGAQNNGFGAQDSGFGGQNNGFGTQPSTDKNNMLSLAATFGDNIVGFGADKIKAARALGVNGTRPTSSFGSSNNASQGHEARSSAKPANTSPSSGSSTSKQSGSVFIEDPGAGSVKSASQAWTNSFPKEAKDKARLASDDKAGTGSLKTFGTGPPTSLSLDPPNTLGVKFGKTVHNGSATSFGASSSTHVNSGEATPGAGVPRPSSSRPWFSQVAARQDHPNEKDVMAKATGTSKERSAPVAKKPTAKGPVGKKFTPGKNKTLKQRFDWFQKHRSDEKKYLIANGTYQDPEKPVRLSDAITIVGTCQDMCPEIERVKRAYRQEIWPEEAVDPYARGSERKMDEPKMVKKFARSAAGADEQLPSDLRPPAVLRKTLDYLIHDVIANADSLARVHYFIWDRTRAIRNDFSIQAVETTPTAPIAIDCFERILRFHVLSMHVFSMPGSKPYPEFTSQQEFEQLSKTLKSLQDYYEDSYSFYRSPNFTEFTALMIILMHQESTAPTPSEIEVIGQDVFQSTRVQTALTLARYLKDLSTPRGRNKLDPIQMKTASTDYCKFFALVASPQVSFMMGCCAEIYFQDIRWHSLNAIFRATYPSGQCTDLEWTLEELRPHLGFETAREVKDFLNACKLRVSSSDAGPSADFRSMSNNPNDIPHPDRVYLASGIVERKRADRSDAVLVDGIDVVDFDEADGTGERDENRVPQALDTPYTYEQANQFRDMDETMHVKDADGIASIVKPGATSGDQPVTEPVEAQELTNPNRGNSLFDRITYPPGDPRAPKPGATPGEQPATEPSEEPEATNLNRGKSLFDRITYAPGDPRAPKPATVSSQPSVVILETAPQKDIATTAQQEPAASAPNATEAQTRAEEAKLRALTEQVERYKKQAEEAARQRAEAEAAEQQRQAEAVRAAVEAERQRVQAETAQRNAQAVAKDAAVHDLAFKMVTERGDGLFDQYIEEITGPLIDDMQEEMEEAELQERLRSILTRSLRQKYFRRWVRNVGNMIIIRRGAERRAASAGWVKSLSQKYSGAVELGEHNAQAQASSQPGQAPTSASINGTAGPSFSASAPVAQKAQKKVDKRQSLAASMPPPPKPAPRSQTSSRPNTGQSQRDGPSNASSKPVSVEPYPAPGRPSGFGRDTTQSSYFQMQALGLVPPEDYFERTNPQSSREGSLAGSKRSREDEDYEAKTFPAFRESRKARRLSYSRRFSDSKNESALDSSPSSGSNVDALLTESKKVTAEAVKVMAFMEEQVRKASRDRSRRSSGAEAPAVRGPSAAKDNVSPHGKSSLKRPNAEEMPVTPTKKRPSLDSPTPRTPNPEVEEARRRAKALMASDFYDFHRDLKRRHSEEEGALERPKKRLSTGSDSKSPEIQPYDLAPMGANGFAKPVYPHPDKMAPPLSGDFNFRADGSSSPVNAKSADGFLSPVIRKTVSEHAKESTYQAATAPASVSQALPGASVKPIVEPGSTKRKDSSPQPESPKLKQKDSSPQPKSWKLKESAPPVKSSKKPKLPAFSRNISAPPTHSANPFALLANGTDDESDSDNAEDSDTDEDGDQAMGEFEDQDDDAEHYDEEDMDEGDYDEEEEYSDEESEAAAPVAPMAMINGKTGNTADDAIEL